MRRVVALLASGLVALLTACATAVAGPNDPGPEPARPSADDVLASSDEFAFTFMPGEDIANVEWDVEIDFDTGDVQAVFDFYDSWLTAAGFTRNDFVAEDDEVEAAYSNAATGVNVAMRVELEDGDVQVDLDIDDLMGPFPAGFTLTSFGGLDVPVYDGADAVDVEWDFHFDHPSAGTQAGFDYYDGPLADLGWTQTEIDDGDDEELEAEYERDGVRLELEVEAGSAVELELNDPRFY